MKKALTKRLRVTKNGKIIRRKMGIGHNGSRSSRKKQRRIIGGGVIDAVDSRLIGQALIRMNHFKKATRSNR